MKFEVEDEAEVGAGGGGSRKKIRSKDQKQYVMNNFSTISRFHHFSTGSLNGHFVASRIRKDQLDARRGNWPRPL